MPRLERAPTDRPAHPSGGRARHRRALAILAVTAAGLVLPACELAPPATGSVLIGCDAAAARTTVTATSHLDPSCVYSGGFDITASDVILDCQGATIRSTAGAGGRGIEVSSPVDTPMDAVTVRNCRIEGFLNSLRVTRPGFRDLAEGVEYEHPTSDILIEDNVMLDSRGVGMYVDGYVTGVTIRRNRIMNAGSSGIYLETGSKQSIVRDNVLFHNGYRENGPGGQLFRMGSTDLWFWGVGREGVSIDGSFENTVTGNVFAENSAGGIFLYKNCGEYPDSGRYFERRTPSDRNTIESNTFVGGRNGVWIGSRMAENTYPMQCTDPASFEGPLRRVVPDHAEDNVVRANRFVDVTYGVRVEDDGNTVTDNRFEGSTPDRHAVIIGTPVRTEVLGLPVTGTVLTGNASTISGNASPFRWVAGQAATTESGNTALGTPAPLCEGVDPPRQTIIFVIAVALAGPGGTPPATTPDLTVPTLGPLPACAPA